MRSILPASTLALLGVTVCAAQQPPEKAPPSVTQPAANVCLFAGQPYSQGAARDDRVCEQDPDGTLVWRTRHPAGMSFPTQGRDGK